jgi:hypothetical protein
MTAASTRFTATRAPSSRQMDAKAREFREQGGKI